MYIIQSVQHKTLMYHCLPWLLPNVSPGLYPTADNHKEQNTLIPYTWLYIRHVSYFVWVRLCGCVTEVKGSNRETHSLLRALCCLGCRLFPPQHNEILQAQTHESPSVSTYTEICCGELDHLNVPQQLIPSTCDEVVW